MQAGLKTLWTLNKLQAESTEMWTDSILEAADIHQRPTGPLASLLLWHREQPGLGDKTWRHWGLRESSLTDSRLQKDSSTDPWVNTKMTFLVYFYPVILKILDSGFEKNKRKSRETHKRHVFTLSRAAFICQWNTWCHCLNNLLWLYRLKNFPLVLMSCLFLQLINRFVVSQ